MKLLCTVINIDEIKNTGDELDFAQLENLNNKFV